MDLKIKIRHPFTSHLYMYTIAFYDFGSYDIMNWLARNTDNSK